MLPGWAMAQPPQPLPPRRCPGRRLRQFCGLAVRRGCCTAVGFRCGASMASGCEGEQSPAAHREQRAKVRARHYPSRVPPPPGRVWGGLNLLRAALAAAFRPHRQLAEGTLWAGSFLPHRSWAAIARAAESNGNLVLS